MTEEDIKEMLSNLQDLSLILQEIRVNFPDYALKYYNLGIDFTVYKLICELKNTGVGKF